MNEEMKQKLNEALKDKEYVKQILSLKSAEEMSKELSKKEIDISPNEIRKIEGILKKKKSGELSEEELSEISGGDWSNSVSDFFIELMCD